MKTFKQILSITLLASALVACNHKDATAEQAQETDPTTAIVGAQAKMFADESVLAEILEGTEGEVYRTPTDIIVEKLAEMPNLHWRYEVRAILKSDEESNETASSIHEHMSKYQLSWQ